MWHLIQMGFQPLFKRLIVLKYLVLTIAIMSFVLVLAYSLDFYEIYLGFLITTPIPIMGYLAMVDLALLIVLYALVSRQLNTTMKLAIYSLIYVLFSVSGTGLDWSSVVINIVTLVMTPFIIHRFSKLKWGILAVTTAVLTMTFVFSGAPGQSWVMGIIYFMPVVVLVSLELNVSKRLIHDIFTAVTLVYPAMFIGVVLLLIHPNGEYHYQTLSVGQQSFIISQKSVLFIDQVYELTVYEELGWGFYRPIYTYTREWEVGLWTMQDASLTYDNNTYTLTLVSPDLSEQFSDHFTQD